MGKKRITDVGGGAVVLSSSDDEGTGRRSLSSNRSYSKNPKSRPLVTRTVPRESKRRRISGSLPRLRRESSGNLNEVGFPSEDFEEIFSGSQKVSPGFGRGGIKELWVDKYKPRSFQELAVHKKKVEEVKSWFEERLRPPKENSRNNVLVITGRAGVGKSATVHVIASHFGATLCEWNAPTPTIWQEHTHNASAGIRYTSKLDEFINFIEKTRKYGLIPSSCPPGSKPSIILLIDDLPMTSGKLPFERLQNCLVVLVRSTQIPTAILLTDYGNTDSADPTARRLEELQFSLERAGACKVAFNPITNNSINKSLTRICREENCNVTTEQIDLLVKASGGDIRHAITSLQLFCVKPEPMMKSLLNPTLSNSEGNSNEIGALVSGFSLLFGRDDTLSLFHALGKFLHNKRESEVAITSDLDAFLVREKFSRLPLKMDAPEKVLCQAHGQARPIADFLHENVLDFISNDAMDDAWDVASYLSDADLLVSSFQGIFARYNEAENVLQSAAASVAVRGVLYGNAHPMASRWHAIRKPVLWHVEQSMSQNQKEMLRQRYMAFSGSSSPNVSDLATEYTPALRWLGYRDGNETSNGNYEMMSCDEEEKENEISDDEIEDW